MKQLYDFSVIDIETTGLDPRFDDITELAAVRVRNGQIVDSFQELVKPCVPIPRFLEEKTHITNAMVQNARTLAEVLPCFLNFICDDVLMGYNIDRFDKNFIRVKASKLSIRFSPKTCDVFPMARRAFRGKVSSFRLDALREALGIESEGSHRALKDCCDTFGVYQQMMAMPEASTVLIVPYEEWRQGVAQGELDAEQLRRLQELETRHNEIMSWFPNDFTPIQKTFYPKDYEARWAFVRVHPFATLSGAIVSITGASDVMPRITAENVVAKLGATLKSSTTRNCDFCIALSDDSSGKVFDAKRWQEKGSPIQIINDRQFIDLVKASIEEEPPLPETVAAYKTEIEERRKARAEGERRLKEWIKANLKKKVKPEELHSWRQSFSELWNQILADDVIEPKELEELRNWLLNHMRKCSDYGAMFKLIDNVVADDVVDYEESLQLFDAAQKCLETMGAAKATAETPSESSIES